MDTKKRATESLFKVFLNFFTHRTHGTGIFTYKIFSFLNPIKYGGVDGRVDGFFDPFSLMGWFLGSKMWMFQGFLFFFWCPKTRVRGISYENWKSQVRWLFLDQTNSVFLLTLPCFQGTTFLYRFYFGFLSIKPYKNHPRFLNQPLFFTPAAKMEDRPFLLGTPLFQLLGGSAKSTHLVKSQPTAWAQGILVFGVGGWSRPDLLEKISARCMAC